MPSEPIDPAEGHDPEVSAGESPQAMRLFNDETEPDVHLDPGLAAFDRVQDGKQTDAEVEPGSTRRPVRPHGDPRGEASGDASP